MPVRTPTLLISTLLITALDWHHQAPLVWQADVRVQTLTVTEAKPGGSLSVRIVVATESAARAVRIEIMLPIGVGVQQVPTACRPSPSPVNTLNARVSCELGDLPVRSSRDILITTTARMAEVPVRVAVFALSDTPDPLPANNFAVKTLP
ncbi:MAG: hypothetical protein ABJB74_02010 [Gemmatimonas sp.]